MKRLVSVRYMSIPFPSPFQDNPKPPNPPQRGGRCVQKTGIMSAATC